MQELIFATGNMNKVDEVREILGPLFPIITLPSLGFTADIPETGSTLRENALQKARFVASRFHKNCFADDTGLEIDALNGAPGVYSARYAGEGHDFKANMDKVLMELAQVPEGPARSARFKCVIALILDGQEHCFEGCVEGEILLAPTGDHGFGYDPIFRPLGYSQSFAQISAEEKNAISHRGHALQLFTKFLLNKDN